MKEVYRSNDTGMLGLYQSILDDAGIAHFVRNESTQPASVGGPARAFFPLPDFWPALCVVDDDDYPAAMELLYSVPNAVPVAGKAWRCLHCGEIMPGNWASCGHCFEVY